MRRTLIDIIRHGEPLGGKRYRGQIDDPLSDRGWRQMREAVGTSCPWEQIISSPLQRCQAFAEELATRTGLPLSVDARWKEIGFGEWEGNTAAAIEGASPGALARFYADPVQHRPPGAEAVLDFIVRVQAAWHHVLDAHLGQHVLVVAHAGTIRAVLQEVLQLSPVHMYRIQVPNAGITRIEIPVVGVHGGAQLLFHGKTRLEVSKS